MHNPKENIEHMRFYSAIRAFIKMSPEEKAKLINKSKEIIDEYEKKNPDQPINLIVTDEDEWPNGWVEAITEIQDGIR